MKKALLLAFAAVFSAVAPALAYPPAPANANFSSEQGVPFGLVLDGRPLTRGMARQVHVDQLMPGQHWADFSLPSAYGRTVRFRSRVWLEPGLETTFVLVTRPGRPLYLQQVNVVPLYGQVPAAGYGPGGYNGGGRYNSPTPYGQGQGGYSNPSDPYYNGNSNGGPAGNYGSGSYPNTPNGGNGSYPSSPNGNYPNGGNGNYPNSPNGSNGNYPNNPNGSNGNYPNSPNSGNGTYPNNSNGTNSNGGGYYPGSATSSYRAMAPADVNALVQTMQQRITEVSKLNAAKEGLSQRSLQADDLTRLLRGLNSEACRVELAKFAASHVADPENFGRVYDAFETEAGAQAVEAAVNAESQR